MYEITITRNGGLSLKNGWDYDLMVNEKSLIEELDTIIEKMEGLKTDEYGNYAAEVTVTIKFLGETDERYTDDN